MGIIGLVIAGLVIGAIARLLMPGRDPIGILGTLAVGVIGMVAGSYLWAALFGDTEGVEWIGGVIVAMVLLYAYRRMSLGRGTV
ncbi:MAG TPA: GlsB/YeaQ/YmgE family stress response membrane protein [Actinomycetota bacterium]|nr:GlsB/YeaQ/YmgE family stress response membrane protein [Actinomycetota bacterium]